MFEFIELFSKYLFGIFIINVIIYFIFKHIFKFQSCNKKFVWGIAISALIALPIIDYIFLFEVKGVFYSFLNSFCNVLISAFSVGTIVALIVIVFAFISTRALFANISAKDYIKPECYEDVKNFFGNLKDISLCLVILILYTYINLNS